MGKSSIAGRAPIEARLTVDTGPPKHLAAVFATFLGTVAIGQQSGEQSAAFEAGLGRGWSDGVVEWWSGGRTD